MRNEKCGNKECEFANDFQFQTLVFIIASASINQFRRISEDCRIITHSGAVEHLPNIP